MMQMIQIQALPNYLVIHVVSTIWYFDCSSLWEYEVSGKRTGDGGNLWKYLIKMKPAACLKLLLHYLIDKTIS